MEQEILDILAKYYRVLEEDITNRIPYMDLVKEGYGEPAIKGVHAMHLPEDPGFYYIIKCRDDKCYICLS